MSKDDKKPSQGEMRRRHQAIIASGVLAKLRSEGRLVLSIALCWADYRTCVFRMSARGAATVAKVHPTTIRRGINQLISAGVIEVGQAEAGKRQKYRFRPPEDGAHGSCPGGAHTVPTHRTHTVSTPDTPGARAAHTPCPARAHTVSGARTACAPYSSIVLKGSSRTLNGPGRNEPEGSSGETEKESFKTEAVA